MEVNLLYNVFHEESFGILIALYFYLTGLSAGSFIISTLAYVFGMERFKPLGKIGVVLAALLLIVAPLCLLLHAGQPFRAWHLFVYINFSSPISWGSFLLTIYPISCIIYGYFMFKGNQPMTKVFGTIGIPLAVMVHGYTGWILAFGKARALWSSALMPTLFLVSAMVSGIAMMIFVTIIWDKFFRKEAGYRWELLHGLSNFLIGMILFDLFIVAADVSHLLISHQDAQHIGWEMLTGSYMFTFIVLENLVGKILPLIILSVKRWRTIPVLTAISIIVMVAIFLMRCNVVLGGEYFSLL
jgi:tetrathionate reductase subunit C